jgi:hypothetical protein
VIGIGIPTIKLQKNSGRILSTDVILLDKPGPSDLEATQHLIEEYYFERIEKCRRKK